MLQQETEAMGIQLWNKMLNHPGDVVERMQTRVTSVGESWPGRAGMLLSWSLQAGYGSGGAAQQGQTSDKVQVQRTAQAKGSISAARFLGSNQDKLN